jgi:hypothetical protein
VRVAIRAAVVALQVLVLQVITACGSPESEKVPGCPEEGALSRVAAAVAPVQPALTPAFVYYFSSDTPRRLMRSSRVDDVGEIVAELPSDAEPLALAASEQFVLYLDEGRSAVVGLPVGEDLPAREQVLASGVSFARSGGLVQRDGVFVWAASLESAKTDSFIARWAPGDEMPEELSVLASERVVHLVAAEGSVLLQVQSPEGARVLRVDEETGSQALVAELDCDGLFVQGARVYCPIADDLYSVPAAGGTPVRARSAAHVYESVVVDTYWYLLLPSTADSSRTMVARLPLEKGNVQLLGCGAVRASGLIADSQGVFWHSLDGETGVRSLDRIAL